MGLKPDCFFLFPGEHIKQDRVMKDLWSSCPPVAGHHSLSGCLSARAHACTWGTKVTRLRINLKHRLTLWKKLFEFPVALFWTFTKKSDSCYLRENSLAHLLFLQFFNHQSKFSHTVLSHNRHTFGLQNTWENKTFCQTIWKCISGHRQDFDDILIDR